MAAVNATRRLPALALIGGLFIALDLVGAAGTGVLGLTIIISILAIRVYAVLAQTALTSCKVQGFSKGSLEGRDLDVSYEICNNSLVPIAFVELSLKYPWYLRLSRGSRGGIIAIPPKGCIEYRVSLTARVGFHRIGPLKAVFRDPLGLYRGLEIDLGPIIEVRVRPIESEKIASAMLLASRLTGVSRSLMPGEGVEFYSVRDYRPGDELKRVYWKALARGRLAVKEFERETSSYILFLLALDDTMLQGPYLETPFEHASRIISMVSSLASRRGDYLALMVVGSGSLSSTRFRRGRHGYINVLRALSSIDYESFMLKTSPKVRAVIKDRLYLAKYIKSMSPRDRVNVIALTSTGDELVGIIKRLSTLEKLGYSLNVFILVHQLYGLQKLDPFERAVYRLRVYEDLKRAYTKVRELRALGINASMVTPWELPSKIVASMYRYEV